MRNLILATFVLAVLSACTTLKTSSDSSGLSKLDGNWELDYISGPRIAFNGLYPGKKPTIKFELAEKRLSGNSSCNSFYGKLDADDTHISFNTPFATTKMACPGEGETIFFDMLKKVNLYNVSGDTTLNFMMGDIAIMRFVRK